MMFNKCRTTILASSCQSTRMADDDTQIRGGHDRIAKRLFAHADVVAEMLRRFLPQGPLPEFDAAMASRMTVQCAMAWEDCQRRGDAVPAIVPLVFYTGRPRWKAAGPRVR